MAKCPKCKEEIESLAYCSKVEVTQTFDLMEEEGGKTYPNYSGFEEIGDHTNEEYKCPECYETVATDEEEAIEILKEE